MSCNVVFETITMRFEQYEQFVQNETTLQFEQDKSSSIQSDLKLKKEKEREICHSTERGGHK